MSLDFPLDLTSDLYCEWANDITFLLDRYHSYLQSVVLQSVHSFTCMFQFHARTVFFNTNSSSSLRIDNGTSLIFIIRMAISNAATLHPVQRTLNFLNALVFPLGKLAIQGLEAFIIRRDDQLLVFH
jgi:hypothetical protein